MLLPDVFSYCWISISNKYVKQVVFINHSWISPTLQKEWELEFFLFFKIWGRVHFSPKKGEVGKIVEAWGLLGGITYVYLLIFLFTNPRNITIQGIYIKVTSFIIYPNFWQYIFYIKIYIIYLYFCIYSCWDIASLFQQQTSLDSP